MDKGFTLSELMIAAAIMLIAILGLLTVFINSIVLNESNANLVMAVNDAQYVLEQIKALAYDDIDSYNPLNFTINNDNIVPELSVQNISTALKNVTITISWTERQRPRSVQLSTHIARTAQ